MFGDVITLYQMGNLSDFNIAFETHRINILINQFDFQKLIGQSRIYDWGLYHDVKTVKFNELFKTPDFNFPIS